MDDKYIYNMLISLNRNNFLPSSMRSLMTALDMGYETSAGQSKEISNVVKIKWESIHSLPGNMALLKSLKKLDLSNNLRLADISSLRNLYSLEDLDLNHTDVTDISPLSELNNLANLDLSSTGVASIKPLLNLQKLKSLNLSYTKVVNISALNKISSLITLNLGNTNVQDIGPVNNLKELRVLDLSHTRVNKINDLSMLFKLVSLDLSNSNISEIKALTRLTSLTNLDLSNTRISSIEPLSSLKKLTRLDLSNTNVIDLNAISKLNSLNYLGLSNTKINEITPLYDLKRIKDLDLSYNKSLNNINALSKMANLENLNLSETSIRDINALSRMLSIENLNLSNNPYLKDISALSSLTLLKKLDLSYTKVSDISALSRLADLLELDIHGTNVSDISKIAGLNSLRKLDLRFLTMAFIPEQLLDLNLDFIMDADPQCPGIYIYGLTLTEQPIEIFSKNRNLIRAYYNEQDYVPVNECKVIFLGDAEAGKTYSIRRILRNGLKPENFDGNATPGIEMSVSSRKLDGSDITVNYWDFGGQEIQRSMHRMFLTERTIYVVFLNARQDPITEKARYWLENIKSYAPQAPVVLVINKIDQNRLPKMNDGSLIEDYGNQIKKIVRMSALQDGPEKFMAELQGSIDNVIREMPSVKKMIPVSWRSLMEDIRTWEEYLLTTDEFKKKCAIFNVKDFENIHDELVEIFQQIGLCFYYKNRALDDYLLLDPKWLVNALYTIVSNSDVAAKNGIIKQDNLYDLLQKDTLDNVPIKRLIPQLRYSGSKVNYILGVTRMFMLSFQHEDGSEFFPMLCEGEEKISVRRIVSKKALHLIFRYVFLPENVIHRVIVKMKNDLVYNYVWYSGAVFRNKNRNLKAYIHSKGNDLHIYVENEGGIFKPREYLSSIQDTVREINTSMGLTAEEYVTFWVKECEAILLYSFVIGNLKNDIKRVYEPQTNSVINLNDVLDRYNERQLGIAETLLQEIVKALGRMQNNRTFYKSNLDAQDGENARNRVVADLLRSAGYICSDQQTGGTSPTENMPGERDILIQTNNGVDLMIYEGMNLKYTSKTKIDDHLVRLLKYYNPQGLPHGVLVTYLECDVTKFGNFVHQYQEHIAQYAPKSFHCNGEPAVVSVDGYYYGQYLKCIEMNYISGDSDFTIYHIIVRIET